MHFTVFAGVTYPSSVMLYVCDATLTLITCECEQTATKFTTH